MAIEYFFRHRCNIFSLILEDVDTKYGLPYSDKKVTYDDTPIYSNHPCFFGTANTLPKSLLSEPVNTYDGYDEIDLPIQTNIKKGDKIVDLRFNLEYTAEFPENIRDKYLSVPLSRKFNQENL